MTQTQLDQNEFADLMAREGVTPPGSTSVSEDEADALLTVKTQEEVARVREFIEPAWNAINDFLMLPDNERLAKLDENGRMFVSLAGLYESKDFSVVYGKGAQMETGTLVLCTGLLPYNLETRELATRQLADLWIALYMTRCGSMVEKIAIELLDPKFQAGVPHFAAHFVVTTTMNVTPASLLADSDAPDTDAETSEPDPSQGDDI